MRFANLLFKKVWLIFKLDHCKKSLTKIQSYKLNKQTLATMFEARWWKDDDLRFFQITKLSHKHHINTEHLCIPNCSLSFGYKNTTCRNWVKKWQHLQKRRQKTKWLRCLVKFSTQFKCVASYFLHS